jgi:predicted MFS family arabinose efflux permease
MFTVMLLGAFMGILNETLLATALPTIMEDFQLSENKVQWLTTGFLLTNGITVTSKGYSPQPQEVKGIFVEHFGEMATLHGYNSAFWIASFLAIIAMLLSFFLRGAESEQTETRVFPQWCFSK